MVYMGVGKALLVPSPFVTFRTLIGMLGHSNFYYQIGATLLRVIIGIVISVLGGSITAFLSYKCYFFRRLITPFINCMKATPVMAITVIAVLWFKANEVPIFVCFLMCYPIVYTNGLMGLLKLDAQLIELNKVYNVPWHQALKKCYLPQVLPYFKAALQLVTSMAWKVTIAAEVLAVPKYAMGYQMLSAKIYLETAEVFAWLIVIILLSQLCEKGVSYLLHYKEGQHD